MDALIGFCGSPDSECLTRMAQTLAHRGAVEKEYESAESSFTFARLAHLSDCNVGVEVGPRFYCDESVAIVFCGYLTSVGTIGSSCVLQHLAREYRERGKGVLERLQGAFLVAIGDHRTKQVHLARDGSGTRTLFYAPVGDRWLFASEPKAITGDRDFRSVIRPAAIAQYLSFSFTPGNGTMLEDLYELPCGHVVTLEPGKEPSLFNFFPFETEEAEDLSPASPEQERQWITKTKETIAAAVAKRLPRGEPVGVFLSGGLDSSLVAAEVARQHTSQVITYALHFGPKYANELEYAAAVARHCGTRHHEILIRPRDFVPRMEEMVWHLDEPIGDPITQPNFELARRVSEDVRWVFNGEGGDPLFGGPKNLPMMMQHWYGVPRGKNFREQAYLASYRRAYEECSRLLHPDIRDQIDPQRDLESIIEPFFSTTDLKSFLNKLMAINIRLKGAHLILPKVERMLAASQLSPLAPLFDEDLIRLSFQMPPTMKLRLGIEKWVLKRAYEDDLPHEIIDRPKSGMRVPVHHWFRREMRSIVRKTLSMRRLRRDRIFDPQRVRQLMRYDIEEHSGRFGMRLWMLMTFELWRRQVVTSS